MPLDEETLGFTNSWYKPALETSQEREISPGVKIKVVTPPFFCATKLEAFDGRGNGDYLASHDLEDLITVIDGRAELVEEIYSSPEDVRLFIAAKIDSFMKDSRFIDALPGHLQPDEASQKRLGVLMKRLKQIAEINRREDGSDE
jgi:hypothetical protein